MLHKPRPHIILGTHGPLGLCRCRLPLADFDTHTATQIIILAANISGSVAAGWKAQVFANSKLSNLFTVT